MYSEKCAELVIEDLLHQKKKTSVQSEVIIEHDLQLSATMNNLIVN